jgi:hypothetical protein
VFWLVQKENDPLGGERLPPHKVKIRSHKTGAVDAKGNPVTAPYLELLRVSKGAHDDGEGDAQPFTFREPGDAPKPTAAEEKALVALARAIREHGVIIIDDTAGFPDDVLTISKEQWRAEFEADDKRGGDSCRKAFTRAVKNTTEKALVNARNDRFWPAEAC